MSVIVVYLVLLLGMTGHSSAIYCTCKDGLNDTVYQKDIDYACGAGADCSSILQSGSCYNPNTVKDHCNYAVNSYYQKKNQVTGSCDFSGSATATTTLASSNSACVYPSSPSTAGTSTTPSTGTPPSTGTGTGTGTTPSTGITTTPSAGTGSTTTTTPPSVFGLGPTGSGSITNTDSKATVTIHQTTHLCWSFILTLMLFGPMLLWL